MPIHKVSKYFFSKEHSLLGCGLALFMLAGVINLKTKKPVLKLTKQETALNINKNILLYLHAGNKRLLTDLLWVQTLIESDIERYRGKDLNNWLFLRFNTIATLDPLFYENYFYGGQFLAIIKDDLEGANYIYKRGLEFYPDDYKLNLNAGFLNYFEMGNFAEGIPFLSKVQDHPMAPVYLKSIISKLMASSGVDLEEVFALVLHNYETAEDKALKNKLQKELYAIRSEIDLICLNNNKVGCNKKDLLGVPYIQKGNDFFSPQYFTRYRIKTKETNSSSPSSDPINFLK